jgi:hypothetical protein
VCRTALSMTVEEHCRDYCRYREAVKLFRFPLSPYSLVGTCSIVHNRTFHRPAQMGVLRNLCGVSNLVLQRSYMEEIVAAPGLENRSYDRRDWLR